MQIKEWEPIQNSYRTGEADYWRAQQNLMLTRTQEKGAVTPQETEPVLPECPESMVERGSTGFVEPWCAGISPFEGDHHYAISPNYREGTQPHPSVENWI